MENYVELVYMAAGVSSRFGGGIKQLAKIGPNGETLIEYSLKQAVSAGFSKIILVVGNKTEEPLKKLIGDSFNGVPVFYALQKFNEEKRDKPWGTVDALCVARNLVNFSFVVCNGDDIYGENTFKILVNHLKEFDEEATIGNKLGDCLSERGTVNRGIFQVDSKNYVQSITETFDIEKSNLELKELVVEDLCSQNIFALHLRTIKLLNIILERFKTIHHGDRKAECLLPNELSNLIKSNEIKMRLYSTPDKWLGVTNPEDEELVRDEIRRASPH